MSGTPTIHHITGTENIPHFITCLAHQQFTTLQVQRTYHISSHVWHTNYSPHYRYREHTTFYHMPGTPTIHYIAGTQNYHISSHVWYTNYPSHYCHTGQYYPNKQTYPVGIITLREEGLLTRKIFGEAYQKPNIQPRLCSTSI